MCACMCVVSHVHLCVHKHVCVSIIFRVSSYAELFPPLFLYSLHPNRLILNSTMLACIPSSLKKKLLSA